MFLKISDLHFYNTMQKENLQLQTTNKHLSHFIKIFNKIPLSIRSESNSMIELKKALKNKSYYSLDEFFQDELF